MTKRRITVENALELEKEYRALLDARKFNRAKDFSPYPKQIDFFRLGRTFRERLLMAGNQVGKTTTGGFEIACHLTGRYPKWWAGRKWTRPTRIWAAGVTALSTRDIVQKMLFGSSSEGIGTGMIPKDCINEKEMYSSRGVADAIDYANITHVTGGKSQITFKSYESGRSKWQGATLDAIWFDEEPEDQELYSEGLTRTMATGGMVMLTFTPLYGMSNVVMRFLQPKLGDIGAKDRGYTTMTIDDALHIVGAEKEKIVASFLPHEREARARGVPSIGSGKIFQVPESDFVIPPFELPAHFRYIWGIDFGIEHPFAAVLLAYDPDNDIIYVTNEYRMSSALPLQHAEAMKRVKAWKAPVAWPHDGHIRKEFEGHLTPTIKIYRAHGLNMLPHHSTFVDGSNSTELGILDMNQYLTTKRFRVFSTCVEWLEEYRLYHRKDGKIVKLRDDLMSATRTGFVSRRFAKSILYISPEGRNSNRIAKNTDFDPLAF